MIKKLWKRADLCWIISLIISLTIFDIADILLQLFSMFNAMSTKTICYILVLSIQIIAIILSCHAFTISKTSKQLVVSILCTIFANIILFPLLFLTTFHMAAKSIHL